jgi:hypothetical protein
VRKKISNKSNSFLKVDDNYIYGLSSIHKKKERLKKLKETLAQKKSKLLYSIQNTLQADKNKQNDQLLGIGAVFIFLLGLLFWLKSKNKKDTK